MAICIGSGVSSFGIQNLVDFCLSVPDTNKILIFFEMGLGPR